MSITVIIASICDSTTLIHELARIVADYKDPNCDACGEAYPEDEMILCAGYGCLKWLCNNKYDASGAPSCQSCWGREGNLGCRDCAEQGETWLHGSCYDDSFDERCFKKLEWKQLLQRNKVK
jgi:hypothetical protein